MAGPWEQYAAPSAPWSKYGEYQPSPLEVQIDISTPRADPWQTQMATT